jgi:hypothetical protein
MLSCSEEAKAAECTKAPLSKEELIELVLVEIKKAGGDPKKVKKEFVFNIKEEECDYVIVGYDPKYPGGFVVKISREKKVIYFARMG